MRVDVYKLRIDGVTVHVTVKGRRVRFSYLNKNGHLCCNRIVLSYEEYESNGKDRTIIRYIKRFLNDATRKEEKFLWWKREYSFGDVNAVAVRVYDTIHINVHMFVPIEAHAYKKLKCNQWLCPGTDMINEGAFQKWLMENVYKILLHDNPELTELEHKKSSLKTVNFGNPKADYREISFENENAIATLKISKDYVVIEFLDQDNRRCWFKESRRRIFSDNAIRQWAEEVITKSISIHKKRQKEKVKSKEEQKRPVKNMERTWSIIYPFNYMLIDITCDGKMISLAAYSRQMKHSCTRVITNCSQWTVNGIISKQEFSKWLHENIFRIFIRGGGALNAQFLDELDASNINYTHDKDIVSYGDSIVYLRNGVERTATFDSDRNYPSYAEKLLGHRLNEVVDGMKIISIEK